MRGLRLPAQPADSQLFRSQGEIGPDLFEAACNMGLEGLVSKRADRPYRAGRSKDWVKVKNRCSDASCRSSGWKTRRWNRPVATVVISGNGEGDRTVESPEVKVSVREASNSAGRNNGEPVSPDIA